MTRYPNLLELYKYHPYREPAICDHAGIEPELFQAVLYQGEELESDELWGLARLYQLPKKLLAAPVLVMLDMKKWKHKSMTDEVQQLYEQFCSMANNEGNVEAGKYLQLFKRRYLRFNEAILKDELSYMHLYSIKCWISDFISFSTPVPKRKSLRKAIDQK